MIIIRRYEVQDAEAVGRLIADTYTEFNLDFVRPEELGQFLGPFRYARSLEKSHQEVIVRTIASTIVFVAEDGKQNVGVQRGRKDRLASLFVRGDYHRQGIERRLVERFESECLRQGATVIRVAATLHAVPFYLATGYKRSTGIRTGWSFEGRGVQVQPMRKVLASS